MQSPIFALVAFGLLLTFVQCKSKLHVTEYEIKQGLLSGGRSYSITPETKSAPKFSIRNELFSVGKKLILSEDGHERLIVKHDILHLMSTWTISNATTGQELGQIKNKVKFTGSKIVAEGSFGRYVIKGNFGNHDFSISKDHHTVAKIHKKRLHIHDTYGVKVYQGADEPLVILMAIIVDEIRQH